MQGAVEALAHRGDVVKAAAISIAILAAIAAGFAWWRFDRRAARLVVLEAQRIADEESARLARFGHPSMWGQS